MSLIAKNSVLTKTARQRGFTLLEVLVVITIIGILVGITVLSFGAVDQRRLTTEAARLKLAFEQAADATLMKQITLGWFYQEEEKQYRFQQLDETNGQWLAPKNPVFKSYTISGPVELKIQTSISESKEYSIQQRERNNTFLRQLDDKQKDKNKENDKKNNTDKPQLLFFASGEYTPFDILISDNKRTPIQIKGDGFGQIRSAFTQN